MPAQRHTIDATKPTYLRAGIKWDALERDKLDELHSIGTPDAARRKLKIIPYELRAMRFIASILRILGLLESGIERIEETCKLRESVQEDLKTYLKQENIQSYDLDLCGFCYSREGKLVGFVTPTLTEMYGDAAQQSSFLHSGDDITGTSEVFDEEMLINLHTLDDSIHQVFVLIVSFNYAFNKVPGGYCALISTKNEEELIANVLQTEEEARVYVMAKLTRDEMAWQVEEVGAFGMLDANDKIPLHKRVDQLLLKQFVASQ